jgi:hypothetical protein
MSDPGLFFDSDSESESEPALRPTKRQRQDETTICQLVKRRCQCKHRICFSQFTDAQHEIREARKKFKKLEPHDKVFVTFLCLGHHVVRG